MTEAWSYIINWLLPHVISHSVLGGIECLAVENRRQVARSTKIVVVLTFEDFFFSPLPSGSLLLHSGQHLPPVLRHVEFEEFFKPAQ